MLLKNQRLTIAVANFCPKAPSRNNHTIVQLVLNPITMPFTCYYQYIDHNTIAERGSSNDNNNNSSLLCYE
jgi:hypothetical protein